MGKQTAGIKNGATFACHPLANSMFHIGLPQPRGSVWNHGFPLPIRLACRSNPVGPFPLLPSPTRQTSRRVCPCTRDTTQLNKIKNRSTRTSMQSRSLDCYGALNINRLKTIRCNPVPPLDGKRYPRRRTRLCEISHKADPTHNQRCKGNQSLNCASRRRHAEGDAATGCTACCNQPSMSCCNSSHSVGL